jgi:hypothetical protein
MGNDGGSKFSDMVGTAVSTFLTIGLVSALIKLGTSNSGPTPEQKAVLQAQEEQRKAEIARLDAQKEEAFLQEERRKAYFSTPSPG